MIQFDNAMHNQAGSLERRPTQLPECALKHSFLLVEMFKLHRNQECHYSTDSTSTRIALELPTFVIFAMVVISRGESVKIVNGLSVEAGWQYPPSAELFK